MFGMNGWCKEIPGGDLISRAAAIDALDEQIEQCDKAFSSFYISMRDEFAVKLERASLVAFRETLEYLPPAQPEIIYCNDCVKHNKGLGNYEVHPDGSSTWIWKDSACPLVSWRDKAQGHEFDYQFCAYAERRDVTE